MASLNVVFGNQIGKYFELAKRPLSVGREASRDIQITDPKVSRKHAMIRHEEGSYVIEPTEAKNPIKIDDEAISGKEVLNEGDILTLGDTYLLFTEMEEDDRIDAVNEQKILLANERTLL